MGIDVLTIRKQNAKLSLLVIFFIKNERIHEAVETSCSTKIQAKKKNGTKFKKHITMLGKILNK